MPDPTAVHRDLSRRHRVCRPYDGATRRLQALAFFGYATLSLSSERSCPSELRARIVADAASVQTRRGQNSPISASGLVVLLGSAFPRDEEPSSDP
jgi:hypothetical protein